MNPKTSFKTNCYRNIEQSNLTEFVQIKFEKKNMVFETSCWVTGSISLNNNYSNSCNNSVQRRSKLDFFDTNMVNASPIVSCISSNGYYGYCPTNTTINNSVQQNSNEPSGGDTAMAIDPISSSEMHTQDQQHQGHISLNRNRKRNVHQSTNDEEQLYDAKRYRNDKHFDYTDGLFNYISINSFACIFRFFYDPILKMLI